VVKVLLVVTHCLVELSEATVKVLAVVVLAQLEQMKLITLLLVTVVMEQQVPLLVVL
jgi:hypothetical protein